MLAAGAEVDDSSRDPLIMLKKLVMDRAQATAIQTEVADSILAAHPGSQACIERLSPVLVEKPYYLVFLTTSIRPIPNKAGRCGCH